MNERIGKIPQVKRAKFTSFLSRDVALQKTASTLVNPNETYITTKLCTYNKNKYYFIVFFPKGINIRNYVISFSMLLTVWVILFFVLYYYLLLNSFVSGITSFIVACLAFKVCMKPPEIWRNCTGFLALNKDYEIIDDIDYYKEIFKGYIVLEETFFRPKVDQKLPTSLLRKKLEILEMQLVALKKRRLPHPKTDLERDIIKSWDKLFSSAEDITPLIIEEEILKTEVRNLMIQISEDCDLKVNQLDDKLKRLEAVNLKLKALLEKRADEYEKYITLLEKKYSIRLRASKISILFSFVKSSILSLLIGTVYPFTYFSYEFLKYIVDLISGVKSLHISAKKCELLDKKIKTLREIFDYEIAVEKVRLPMSED